MQTYPTPTSADVDKLITEVGGQRNTDTHTPGKIQGFTDVHEEYVRIRFGVPEDVWYDSEYDPFTDVSLENYVEGIQNGTLLDPLPSGYTSVRELCKVYQYPIERILGEYGPPELEHIKYIYNFQFEVYVAPEDKAALTLYLHDHGAAN